MNSGRERQRFPSLKDDIGEDPAKYLDKQIWEKAESDCSNAGWAMQKRIEGIDEIAVVRAWQAVERRLDRGPRDRIMAMLDEREQELEEIGERPERTEQREPRDLAPADCYIIRDGSRVEYSELNRDGAAAKLQSSSSERAVTDGGEK